MNSYFNSFPRQKLSSNQKGPKWYKQCIDTITESSYLLDEGVRANWKEKLINTDLYNGKLNPSDIREVLNPESLHDESIPTTMQHYPIINPRIDVLVGEEAKRRFDYKAIVTNPEAVSAKEEEKNNELNSKIRELIESNYTEQELEIRLRELAEDARNYQDKREVRANRILRHLWNELKLERVFNAGFKDALILGEEYYQAEIVSNEPFFRKLNPHKVFSIRSGFSNRIEDSDLIFINDYWSPGQILDHFHDELKDADVKKLERGYGDAGDDPFVDKLARDFSGMAFTTFDSGNPEDMNSINSLINLGELNGFSLNEPYDASGNVRVLRVYWRGWRKVQEITYFDEFGNEQKDIFPESYIPKKDEGESSKPLWINEWYEGTKIGKDIYVNLRPKQIQYRSMNNPSYCHPGITGRAYSFNSSQTVSLMSKVKNYQYLYDVLHDRLNKAIARNHGKILEIDLAMIPEGWEPEKWILYMKKMGIAIKDSFKEGNKGAATGKLAGGMNNASKGYIDLETGAYIQQQIALMEFIKQEMSEITGVSDQRLGQISNRETVGGVERSVTQSSHITEWYFSEHDDVKIEALRILLETAKIAYKGQNKKVQYILDDQSIQMLNLDGDEFSENDYGIVLTSSARTQEAEQKLKQLAEVALNAGTIDFATISSIYLSDSLSDIKSKVEKAERDKNQREQEQFAKQQEAIQQKTQQDAEDKQADRDLKKYEVDLKAQTEIQKALLNKDEAPVDNSKEIEKLNLDRQKRLDQVIQFNEKLELEKQKFYEDKKQFQEKLQVEKKKANKVASKT
jgi:hypothetical protein